MAITRSQYREQNMARETAPTPKVVVKNEVPITRLQQCERKTASEAIASSKSAAKNRKKAERKEKKAILKTLMQLWGTRFVSSYIPVCQRPGEYDSSERGDGTDPYAWKVKNWPLPLLKAILVIAKLTTEQKWVRDAIVDVVNYRIRNTEDHRSNITEDDLKIIRNMFLNEWSVENAFKMNPLFRHRGQDESRQEIKHIFDISREFDDESDANPKNREAEYGRSKYEGDTSGLNVRQRGIAAAPSKAQSEGSRTQKPISKTSSSLSRSEKQKKRKHSAVDDALLEAISAPINRQDFTRDHTSGHSRAKHPSYDVCSASSSSSSLRCPSPPARSSTTKLVNGKTSRYGMFPPPQPCTRTLSAQKTSEPKNHKEKHHSRPKQETVDLTMSPPGRHKDNANTRLENNNHKNDGDEEDEKDDAENIFKAKLAAAEAELNLARLRVAAAESAARKAKKARTRGMSRGTSTSSS